jgi:hypothetical protein
LRGRRSVKTTPLRIFHAPRRCRRLPRIRPQGHLLRRAKANPNGTSPGHGLRMRIPRANRAWVGKPHDTTPTWTLFSGENVGLKIETRRCGTTFSGSVASGCSLSFARGSSADGAATKRRCGLSRSAPSASGSLLALRTPHTAGSKCHSCRAITIAIHTPLGQSVACVHLSVTRLFVTKAPRFAVDKSMRQYRNVAYQRRRWGVSGLGL